MREMTQTVEDWCTYTSNGMGQCCLSTARGSVQQNTQRRLKTKQMNELHESGSETQRKKTTHLDAQMYIKLRMSEGPLHELCYLLEHVIDPAQVLIPAHLSQGVVRKQDSNGR